MADPAPGLAPQKGTAGITQDPELSIIASDESAIKHDIGLEAKVAGAYRKKAEAIQTAESTDVHSLMDKIGSLKPPERGESPKLEATTQTSPTQAWSSAAMMLAAVGSLFTRRPLATAMKTAAVALNAFHDGDQARADAAFAKWKVDMDNYWKVQNFEMDLYKSALGQYIDQAKIEADLGKQEQETALAEVNQVGLMLKDDVMAHTHSIETAARMYDDRTRLNAMLGKSAEETTQSYIFTKAFAEWHDDFVQHNGREPTFLEQANEIGQLKNTVGHQMTDEQKATQERDIASKIAGSDLGKGYSGVVRNWRSVQNFPEDGGVIPQAMLQDAYTQLINGNRAIRGFQAKMNTEHAGLWDRVMIEFQQIFKSGGSLSPQMIHDIKFLSAELVNEWQSTMNEQIDDAKEAATALGLDGDVVERLIRAQTGRIDEGAADQTPDSPAPGTVVGNHKFKSGDPSDPKNWEVVSP